MADDPWLGHSSTDASDKYDVDKFYTASRNAKGFGSSLRITVSPQLLAEIGSMVASRQIPEYRVNADFFRDAIVHRLHYLSGKIVAGEGFNPSKLSQILRAVDQEERDAMVREARESYIRLIEDNLRRAKTERERREIIDRIAATSREIDDDYLRTELQRFII